MSMRKGSSSWKYALWPRAVKRVKATQENLASTDFSASDVEEGQHVLDACTVAQSCHVKARHHRQGNIGTARERKIAV